MLVQARSDLSAAKKRVKESEERVDVKLPEFVKKKYWCVPRSWPLHDSTPYCIPAPDPPGHPACLFRVMPDSAGGF